MIYLDFIFNLALLIALTVISGFIAQRWPQHTRSGVLLQGVLFGSVAVLAMLRPVIFAPGLIFDGRSVMLSVCALFFGPGAAVLAGTMAIICRIELGGVGTLTGVMVIVSSVCIGLLAHFRVKPHVKPPPMRYLYLLGFITHLAMLALMFTLPGNAGLAVVKRIGLPVLLLYPLATILAGKILSDQLSNIRNIETLKESEERYRLLLDTSMDAILLTTPDGRIFTANLAACRLFGRSKEELIAIGREGIVDNTDPRLAAALEERARTGRFAGELTFVRKDGSKFPGEMSSVLFQNKEGQLCTSMIARDITGSKKAQENIDKLFLRQQIILSAIPDILMEVDANKVYTWANEAGLEFFGKDVIGREASFYLEGEQNVYDHRVAPFFYGSEKVLYIESWQRRQDGQKRLLAWWCRVLKDGEGNVRGALSSARDITERRQAEERLFQKSQLLKAINNVFYETMRAKSEKEVALICLDVALELTDSGFGFIGKITPENLFSTTALSNPGWDACLMPQDKAVAMIDNMVIRGIWGDVILNKQSLIVNDPASYPGRVGLPKDHPALTSFLGVPLMDQNKIIGMIAVANRKSGYTNDIKQYLEALSAALVESIRLKQAEETILQLNTNLEQRIAERTAELSAKSEALERLNHMFVGRELRMKELKARIAELERYKV